MIKSQWVNESTRLILLSHSLLNTYSFCPRKFEFTTIWNRTIPNENSYAADVGTALHEGLQEYLIAKKCGANFDTAQTKATLRFLKYFPWDGAKKQKTKTRSLGECLVLLDHMIKDPQWDDWEPMRLEGDNGYSVEVPFIIEYPEMDFAKDGITYQFAYQGKIDLIVQNRKTKEVKTIDIKTTVLNKDSLEAEYYHSGQLVGYEQVARMMQSPENRQSNGQFSVTYAVYIFTPYGPDSANIVIEKARAALMDYEKNLYEMMYQIKRAIMNDFFPRTNRGCNIWGSACVYFPICKRRDKDYIHKWFNEHGEPWNRFYEHKVSITNPMEWEQ